MNPETAQQIGCVCMMLVAILLIIDSPCGTPRGEPCRHKRCLIHGRAVEEVEYDEDDTQPIEVTKLRA